MAIINKPRTPYSEQSILIRIRDSQVCFGRATLWLRLLFKPMTVAQGSSSPDPQSAVELVCPLCEYSLRGLTEPRCPECGYRFDWEELRQTQGQKHPYLFEQQTTRHLRAFWKTAVGGWLAARFWKALKPGHRSYPRRLWNYFGMVMLVVIAGEALVLGFGGSGVYYHLDFSGMPDLVRQFLRGYSFSIPVWRFNILCPMLTLFWPLASIAAFMIFQISMRKKKLLPIHALRCVLYSADVLLWFGIVLLICGTFDAIAVMKPTGLLIDAYPWAPLFLLLALPVFFYRLCRAFGLYLRFDRPLLTVLATQFIVLLAAFTVVCYVVIQPWR
jgi:hypothetical protein